MLTRTSLSPPCFTHGNIANNYSGKYRGQEGDFDEACTEAARKELCTLQDFALKKIHKRINKAFGLFDLANSGNVNSRQFCLVVRQALDSTGYGQVHDVLVAELAARLPECVFKGAECEAAVSALVKSVKLVQKSAGKETQDRSKYAMEFINENYDSYDDLGVSLFSCMLIFHRLCEEDIVAAYNAFERQWKFFGYNPYTRLAKEELITFILAYVNRTPLRIVSNELCNKECLKVTKQRSENGTGKKIAKLTVRLDKLEGRIEEANSGTDRTQRTQATTSRPLRNSSHKCSSKYCLLCRYSYYYPNGCI